MAKHGYHNGMAPPGNPYPACLLRRKRCRSPAAMARHAASLAAPKSLRIASAMIDLLGMEHGTAAERITALRAVRAESLHDSSQI